MACNMAKLGRHNIVQIWSLPTSSVADIVRTFLKFLKLIIDIALLSPAIEKEREKNVSDSSITVLYSSIKRGILPSLLPVQPLLHSFHCCHQGNSLTTTVIGLITDMNETADRREVENAMLPARDAQGRR